MTSHLFYWFCPALLSLNNLLTFKSENSFIIYFNTMFYTYSWQEMMTFSSVLKFILNTLLDNLVSSIKQMFVDNARKLVHPKETPNNIYTTERSQTAPPGARIRIFLLWGHSATHSSTILPTSENRIIITTIKSLNLTVFNLLRSFVIWLVFYSVQLSNLFTHHNTWQNITVIGCLWRKCHKWSQVHDFYINEISSPVLCFTLTAVLQRHRAAVTL